MIKRITECPACSNKLQVVTLKCKNCGLELHNKFEPNIFETLDSEQYDFLITFLKNRGNMKLLQSELNISYPYAKKKLDDLLIALNLLANEKLEEANMKNIEIISTETWNTDELSTKASDIIKCKLKHCGGRATVSTLESKKHEIIALKDGEAFYCAALPIEPEYRAFDIIVDFLIANGGKAPKGNGRHKVGEEKCDENTVAGIIGISYLKDSYGKSTFDPVFIMAAVLEWAGIAYNQRGFLELTGDYKKKIDF